ncbi:pupal cuticle protein C1B-like [Anabrus simplex]|uniref:pupal cuticle protein C1B-like n=1 Tax=Anabrus simplex TaxID=316456 RepID=UPI0034DD221D
MLRSVPSSQSALTCQQQQLVQPATMNKFIALIVVALAVASAGAVVAPATFGYAPALHAPLPYAVHAGPVALHTGPVAAVHGPATVVKAAGPASLLGVAYSSAPAVAHMSYTNGLGISYEY